MGISGAVGTIAGATGKIWEALKVPIIQRTTRHFERNKKGQVEDIYEDTWTVTRADLFILIWAIIIWRLSQDINAQERAELIALMGILGPVAGTLGLAVASGNKEGDTLSSNIFDASQLKMIMARLITILPTGFI